MTELQAWQVIGQAKNAQPKSKAKLRLRMYVLMALTDIAAISLGFWTASKLHIFHPSNGMAFEQLAIILPLFLVIGLLHQAYSPSIIHDRWASVGRAINSFVMAALTIVLVAFFLKATDDWSRSTFTFGVALSGVLLVTARYMFVRHAHALLGGDPYQIVTIFDGQAPTWHDARNQAIIIHSSDVFDPSKLSPATYDSFGEAIQDADRVIVHCSAEKRQVWAWALKGANVQGEVIAPEVQDLKPLGIAQDRGVPTLIVSRGPLGLKDRLIKRAFDVAVAGTALFLLSPLLLVVAAVIYLQDRGPIFFVQIRVGRSNRMFRIFKFRSMFVHSLDASGNRSASRNDDRITPFGRFIRASSIDEIPQLLNVLRGDMSIVGPRPHALGSTAEDELFWHIDERYWHRHAIKPGLTGLAQVRGFRGATHRKADLVNRLQSDLEYLDRWTIWRDVVILIKTIGVVLHKNAY